MMSQTKLARWLRALAGWIVLWVCACLGPCGVAGEVLPADINPVQLSAADLEFGQRQLDRILHDRPRMTVYVRKGDPIYGWVARQLAGGSARQHVYWSSQFDENFPAEYPSYSVVPNETHRAAIAIRDRYAGGPQKGQAVPVSRLWLYLVYELFNLSNATEDQKSRRAAAAGTISRETYIERNTKAEFAALVKTRNFYRNVWKPMLTRKGLTDDKEHWEAYGLDSYRHWMSKYTDPGSYPFNVFGAEYDKMAAHRARRERH